MHGAGHGGKIETSLLWAVEPDCVDISRAPEHGLPEPRFAMGEDAKQSDRRLGEELIDEMVVNIGAKAKELLEEYNRLQPPRHPLTYDQIEQIWEKEVRPRFSQFASMQALWVGQKQPPENSRWHAQWQIPDRS